MASLQLLPFVLWLGVSLVTAQSEAEFNSTEAPTTVPAPVTTPAPPTTLASFTTTASSTSTTATATTSPTPTTATPTPTTTTPTPTTTTPTPITTTPTPITTTPTPVTTTTPITTTATPTPITTPSPITTTPTPITTTPTRTTTTTPSTTTPIPTTSTTTPTPVTTPTQITTTPTTTTPFPTTSTTTPTPITTTPTQITTTPTITTTTPFPTTSTTTPTPTLAARTPTPNPTSRTTRIPGCPSDPIKFPDGFVQDPGIDGICLICKNGAWKISQGCFFEGKCYEYDSKRDIYICTKHGWLRKLYWFELALSKASGALGNASSAISNSSAKKQQRRRALYSVTMPNNNTIVLSDYCGLGSSMADTPANVYMNLVNYFLSLNASSNPGEIECMTDLLIEFVALVENGTVSFPPSDIPRLLNATEEAITWINTLQQELMASLSTTTTTKTSVTPEVVIPPHEASKRNRLSLQIIQNVVLPQK